ncbi:MAG TPA: hypothetical protein VFH88_11485 [Candidatus Krumholzibacteria bacterium]|nr:hypothetical protein [Candidatus Krumholzibacteria bacterium]
MSLIAKKYLFAVVVACLLGILALPAAAEIELSDCHWETNGSMVTFHLQFHNPDTGPSGSASGEIHSQEFGAFVPDFGSIGTFNVPPLAPDSFFDITYDVSLGDLPPSADRITPFGGGSPTGGLSSAVASLCPPDLFWAGNVDVMWSGPGGTGQANYHIGTLQVCPGGPTSYIHIITNCPDPGGVSWSLAGVCSGWSVTLVTTVAGLPDGPAPNPLPPGFFDGWICVSANASVTPGNQCCFDVLLNCGVQPAKIHLCATTCTCQPVKLEQSTWGKIKSLYRDQE